jgi:hypothetical protein
MSGAYATDGSKNVTVIGMTNDPPMDFYTAAGFGLLSPGIRRVVGLGNNPDVDTGTVPEDIWTGGGLYPFMTVATSLEIVSDSASDAAAGTGARTILLSGLDANYVEQSSILTLNGLTAVAVPIQYFRINQIMVLSAGSNETNVGLITVRDAGAGTTRGLIMIGTGISRQAVYTVPAGHTLSIHSILASLNRTTGTNNVTIGFSFRTFTGVRRLTLEFSISDRSPYRHDGIPGITMAEKTDFSLRTTFTGGNNADVTGAFLGVLVANSILTG